MTMRLLFDVGNTRVKWAWHDGQRWLEPDACGLEVFNPEEVFAVRDFDEAWVASMNKAGVYQNLTDTFEQKYANGLEQKYANGAPRLMTVEVSSKACGIENTYLNIDHLGIDRWLSVIGARSLIPHGDIIVVDAGTAINVECLDSNNIYQGGAILPGFRLMHDSLVSRVAAIESKVSETLPTIGKDTEECVNFGVGYGVAGAVERVVDEMQKFLVCENGEQQTPVRALLAGGNAWSLEKRMALSVKTERVDNLVLFGLLEVARES